MFQKEETDHVFDTSLEILIPKIQYKLTELRTGSKEFPGTANYSKDAENKNTGKNIK